MLEKDELKRGDCRKGGPAGTFRLGADNAGKVGCQQGGLKTSHSDTSHSDGGAKYSFLDSRHKKYCTSIFLWRDREAPYDY